MAERPRMTAAQLADKLLADEHADVLRESVAWMAAQLMETDVAARIGAELGERSSDRLTHRNGYRPRAWETRVGEIELAIPKLRQGSYFPSFLEPRRAGAGRGGAGGLCQRGLDPQGRPAGRPARPAPPEQGPGLQDVSRPGRAGPGVPGAAAGRRLSLPVAGTPRWSGSGRRVGCATRPW